MADDLLPTLLALGGSGGFGKRPAGRKVAAFIAADCASPIRYSAIRPRLREPMQFEGAP
jgi:hypothetical protein